MRLFTIVIAAGILLGGCNPAQQSNLEMQAIEAGRKSEAERVKREQAEARLLEKETTASRWKVAALLALSAVGFALIIGAMLGSDARKDADRK